MIRGQIGEACVVMLQITRSCALDLSSPCLKAQCIVTDYRILCLGLIQSLFEGSMSMYCYRLQDPVPRTYPVPV